jgi:hypothetical protein
MADSELTDLTEATTLATTDLLYAVVDPAGTPLDRKATVATLGVAAAPSFYAPAVSSRWYRPTAHLGGANAAQTLNLMYARPIRLGAGTINRIAAHVAATVTASEVCRLGIYTNDATTNRPSALVVDGGTIDLSASGNQGKAVTVSTAITAGVYWLAAVRQGPTATCQMGCYSPAAEGIDWGTYHESGDPTASSLIFPSLGWVSFVTIASITGALPNPFGSATAVYNTGGCPFVAVRYA